MKKSLLLILIAIACNGAIAQTFRQNFGLIAGYPQNDLFEPSLVSGIEFSIPQAGPFLNFSFLRGHLGTDINLFYLHTQAKYVKREHFYKDFFGGYLELSYFPLVTTPIQPYIGGSIGTMLNFTSKDYKNNFSIMPFIGVRFILHEDRTFDGSLRKTVFLFLKLKYGLIKEERINKIQYPNTNLLLFSTGITFSVPMKEKKKITINLN